MKSSQFEIKGSLGFGATAEVLKARNLKTDNLVALKCFSSFVSQDPESLERLQGEVQILKTLNHPNIVKMFGEHKVDNKFCLELELVEGEDLRQWMKKKRSPLVEPKLWILVQIARGLGAAHEMGIIHRDLKPENILMSQSGEVKLSDFGLAKELGRLTMTRLGLLVGSLGYMAPEVIEGEKVTVAADLFSFGAIAYELLSGQPPFTGETPQTIIKKVLDPIEPLEKLCPHIPQRICQVVDQCLSLKPTDRPESIWQVEAEIMGYLTRTGLIPSCQELISLKSKPEILKKAMQIKRESLLRRKEELSDHKHRNRKALINLANEFQKLFPDDETGLELLLLLKSKESGQGMGFKKPIAFMLIAFLGIAMTYWGATFVVAGSQSLEEKKPSEKIVIGRVKAKPIVTVNKKNKNDLESKKPEVVSEPKEKKFTVKKPKIKQQLRKPSRQARRVPPKGKISFEVETGVQVFVDEKRVPSSQMSAFTVPAGKHVLKLVKPGFLPIENTVYVKAGKTTQIRAKGRL